MKDTYKKRIHEMIDKLERMDWLRMIYSFIKVFAEDGKSEESLV